MYPDGGEDEGPIDDRRLALCTGMADRQAGQMERADPAGARGDPAPIIMSVPVTPVRPYTSRMSRSEEAVKTVLVPMDGSDLAERAIGVAEWAATMFGADLRLFKASFELDLHDEQEQLRYVAKRHGVPHAQIEVSAGRSAAPGIIRASRHAADSVVVMATRGPSGLSATLLGSVTDEVLRDIDEPMVLVGPGYQDRKVPTSIVVLWDGTLLSASVVPAAATWAAASHLPVRLVHVRTSAAPPLEIGTRSARGSLASQVLLALSAGDGPATVTELCSNDPVQTISAVLRDLPGALVAMASGGRGGLTSSALGRVSAKIVQYSPHPVLVSHART